MLLKKLSEHTVTLYSQTCVHVKQFWPQRVPTEILKNKEYTFYDMIHMTKL